MFGKLPEISSIARGAVIPDGIQEQWSMHRVDAKKHGRMQSLRTSPSVFTSSVVFSRNNASPATKNSGRFLVGQLQHLYNLVHLPDCKVYPVSFHLPVKSAYINTDFSRHFFLSNPSLGHLPSQDIHIRTHSIHLLVLAFMRVSKNKIAHRAVLVNPFSRTSANCFCLLAFWYCIFANYIVYSL